MQEYEIRILNQGHGDTIIEVVHLNDHAAVRAARKMARDKAFEVWRGLDCIYAGSRAHLSLVRDAGLAGEGST
jgi:hypothetical protein